MTASLGKKTDQETGRSEDIRVPGFREGYHGKSPPCREAGMKAVFSVTFFRESRRTSRGGGHPSDTGISNPTKRRRPCKETELKWGP